MAATRSIHYRLDETSERQLGATILHLILRGDEVVGRYGRGGHVLGRLSGRLLTATLSRPGQEGDLQATFASDFASFHGRIRFGDGRSEEFEVTGTRVIR